MLEVTFLDLPRARITQLFRIHGFRREILPSNGAAVAGNFHVLHGFLKIAAINLLYNISCIYVSWYSEISTSLYKLYQTARTLSHSHTLRQYSHFQGLFIPSLIFCQLACC